MSVSWIPRIGQEFAGYRIDALMGHGAWSPDARRVAFSGVTVAGDRHYHLYVVAFSGGSVRRLARGAVSTSPAWSPNGCPLAFTARKLPQD